MSRWTIAVLAVSALALSVPSLVSAVSPATPAPSSTGATSSSSPSPSSNSTSPSVSAVVSSVILALGDSFTFGEQNLSFITSDGNRGYPAFLASLIGSSQLNNASGSLPLPSVLNYAIDGETAQSFVTGFGRLAPVEGRTDEILRSENTHYSGSRSNFTQLQMFDEAITNSSSSNLTIVACTLTLGINDLESLALQPGGSSNISSTLADFRNKYGTIVNHIRKSLPTSTPLFLIGYFNPYRTQIQTTSPANNSTANNSTSNNSTSTTNSTTTITPAVNKTSINSSTTTNSSSSINNNSSSSSSKSPAVVSNPAVPIFLAGGPTLNYLISVTAAAQSAIFVDLISAFSGHESEYTYLDVQPSGYNLTDDLFPGVLPIGNVHPNDIGYRVIAQEIFARFNSSKANVSRLCNQNDINALNYALTLEHLESSFYQTFQARFNVSAFISAGFNQYVYPNFALIAAHEAAHVQILSTAIVQLGGSPVPPCSYNFSAIQDVKTYVAIAQLLENTGVSAYDGAVNTLTNINLKETAATIATVEAKHAAYLNQLNVQSPFPSAFDTPISPTSIIAAVLETGFVLSCPYPLVTPIVLVPTVSPALLLNYTSNNVTFTNATSRVNSTVVSNSGGLVPIVITRNLSTTEVENDIKVLNYALLLENTDALFFAFGQSKFAPQDFVNAGYQPVVYGELNAIAAHEFAHATALNLSILALGGTHWPLCNYNFSAVKNVSDYFRIGRLLENTGVSAYDGGINAVSSTELQQILATIATVESRHAGVLNGYNSLTDFPDDLDPALTPPQVVKLLLALNIVSCPFNITEQLPQLLTTAGACPDIAEIEGGQVAASGSASGTANSGNASSPASGSTSGSASGSASPSLSTGADDGNNRAAVVGDSSTGKGSASSGVGVEPSSISSNSGVFSAATAASSTGSNGNTNNNNNNGNNNNNNNGGSYNNNAGGIVTPATAILSSTTVLTALAVMFV